MAKHILLCPKCKNYTMQEECPSCKVATLSPKPPKFSPEDPYGSYRRKAKEEWMKEQGYL